ncbi:MAG: HAMP domain-containing histidine kinase [Deltaproteobacteria bacterium]|nr:HAMP domain-containing histidine kinase [Deltaproteobacteria bacterium]MBW1925569.1 HAMP domain-containing histidine kinase [Deltaproteobacteria bacterium]MBW1948968.1 HAMP domain-containing histidine kinase [Deltaproteobacteria bacterium]MBW2009353.1 HAMP domain-containing histidine kinase [Deltaproteobacteria bacterium]MBW2103150.1 HAMP domain-containing histidine kinase [Deltaproteobacteria bacterium]
MGLSVTRKVVLEHGGEIHVSSNPGKGTTFIVRLPARSRQGNSPG